MALRDVRNYKFLFNAIEQKFRNPNLVSFKGIPYEPQTNPKSIFGTIYSTFRELIGKGLNLHQYLDIGNRSVLENLYRNLNSDLNLKFLARPGTVLNDPKLELSAQYYQELPPEMTAAQQTGQAPTGATTGTAGIPAGLPSTPVAPRISTPRFMRAPKETTPTAETPEPTPPKPQLVTATATGAIKEPPPSKIFVADKSGKIVGEHKIPSFRPSASFINTAKNFGSRIGSRIGVFFKRNVGKYLTVGRIATGVSAGIGAITGGALTGGSPIGVLGGGGMGAFAPSWIKSGGGANFFKKVGNGAINFGANLSNQVSNRASRLSASSGSKKLALGIIGGLLLFVAISGFMGVISGTTPPGEAAPIPGGGEGPPPDSGLSPTIATDCPIPNGVITCGSQFTPIQTADGLCGHCGIGYPKWATEAYCKKYVGTQYGLDIEGVGGQAVYLPKINGNVINWKFRSEEPGETEAIQKYTGVFSGGSVYQTYYLQFHHTQTGSGNASAKQSGDPGGRICIGCGEGHVHIQIGSGGDNQNNTQWLDAAQYFCRQ
ncbi:hypothetical protein KKE03_03750 [Patescibacteria group bacterium]|nr:hypothetical protein [Patescibacteria group bacterium]